MAQISLIAIVDEQWGLGRNNQLLCHLPADLKHFKHKTLGKPIVMGRKTFDSIGRKPLPSRRNIVLSRQQDIDKTGVEFMPTLESAIAATSGVDEVMIIGGAQVYHDAIPVADCIYLTRIKHTFKADVFFPTLKPSEWQLVKSEFYKNDEKNAHDMAFEEYRRAI